MDKQISWTIAAISEFAKAKALSVKQAFNYLSLFKGLDFLQDHYGAEHLLSFDDAVDDLTAICQRNGGQIRRFCTMAQIARLKKLISLCASRIKISVNPFI